MLKYITILSLTLSASLWASDLKGDVPQETKTLVPAKIVDGFLKDYGPEEREAIDKDLSKIEGIFLVVEKPVAPNVQPIYIATVGGPGASKSTILSKLLKDIKEENKDFSYVFSDPDQGALIYMDAYIKAVDNSTKKAVLKAAYDKWRGGSNYISNTLLNKAFEGRYNIVHGATSQGTPVSFYQDLKQKGYKIYLVFCASSDENRVKAIENRENVQHLVQSTPEDARNKADAVYRRFGDYFAAADKVDIYWTDTFSQGSTLAATYVDKKLTIQDQDAFDHFVKDYNDRLAALNSVEDEKLKRVPILQTVLGQAQ